MICNCLNLYTQEQGLNKIGGSCDLIIFLKPKTKNSETNIDFTVDLGEYKNYYEQIIRNFLTKKEKFNYDVCILVRTLSAARGDSAGIAFYLTLHSLIDRIPLPRNLGSTGTVYGERTGAIGGLNLKLEYNVKKEKPINTFILSEANKNVEQYKKFSSGYQPKISTVGCLWKHKFFSYLSRKSQTNSLC